MRYARSLAVLPALESHALKHMTAEMLYEFGAHAIPPPPRPLHPDRWYAEKRSRVLCVFFEFEIRSPIIS